MEVGSEPDGTMGPRDSGQSGGQGVSWSCLRPRQAGAEHVRSTPACSTLGRR